ncbi:MAG TPA: hypothetical protein VEB21_14585 [Terriglobales bacterium]|nr:hypothetical protein [Terriglobales bacterium]
MLPWLLLARAPIPGTADELTLHRRGGEFSIRIGSFELMTSRVHGSEDALAELACARLRDRRGARVLIGGLGMGYTLRAALHNLRRDACVVVAELIPAVIEWNREWLAHLSDRALDDPRVEIDIADVGELIRRGRAGYDAILLDVDNGPREHTRDSNRGLYTAVGLEAARAALRPGGVLGIWSAGPDHAFRRSLQRSGFAVEEVRAPLRAGRRRAHTVWLATVR